MTAVVFLNQVLDLNTDDGIRFSKVWMRDKKGKEIPFFISPLSPSLFNLIFISTVRLVIIACGTVVEAAVVLG